MPTTEPKVTRLLLILYTIIHIFWSTTFLVPSMLSYLRMLYYHYREPRHGESTSHGDILQCMSAHGANTWPRGGAGCPQGGGSLFVAFKAADINGTILVFLFMSPQQHPFIILASPFSFCSTLHMDQGRVLHCLWMTHRPCPGLATHSRHSFKILLVYCFALQGSIP